MVMVLARSYGGWLESWRVHGKPDWVGPSLWRGCCGHTASPGGVSVRRTLKRQR